MDQDGIILMMRNESFTMTVKLVSGSEGSWLARKFNWKIIFYTLCMTSWQSQVDIMILWFFWRPVYLLNILLVFVNRCTCKKIFRNTRNTSHTWPADCSKGEDIYFRRKTLLDIKFYQGFWFESERGFRPSIVFHQPTVAACGGWPCPCEIVRTGRVSSCRFETMRVWNSSWNTSKRCHCAAFKKSGNISKIFIISPTETPANIQVEIKLILVPSGQQPYSASYTLRRDSFRFAFSFVNLIFSLGYKSSTEVMSCHGTSSSPAPTRRPSLWNVLTGSALSAAEYSFFHEPTGTLLKSLLPDIYPLYNILLKICLPAEQSNLCVIAKIQGKISSQPLHHTFCPDDVDALHCAGNINGSDSLA